MVVGLCPNGWPWYDNRLGGSGCQRRLQTVRVPSTSFPLEASSRVFDLYYQLDMGIAIVRELAVALIHCSVW